MSQTIRKVVLLAGMLAVVTGAVMPVWAASWTYVGTSQFTTTPSWMQDYKRIVFNCIAVDAMGNVYATAANRNNNGVAGGLTIYKAGGGQIDVDLNNGGAGLKGAITKMVLGGDGKIYGLQNWLEIHWSYNSGIPNRIIRIDPDGTITPIWSPAHYAWPNDGDRIGGMDVAADGNIYWTTNSADGYWKYHYFWRFDVTQPISATNPAEAPHADQHGIQGLVNDGMSETHRVLDLLYVGRYKEGPVVDWFTVLGRGNYGSPAAYYADAMSWTEARGPAAPNANAGVSDPGWGRDWVTAAAYDPVNKKLWLGGRGTRGTNNPWSFSGGGTNVFVDLEAGNKGLRMKNNVNSLDEYVRAHTAGVTDVTFAARFRVDAYDAGFKGTLMLSHLDTGAGSPIPGICIIGDHFWLVNCFDSPGEVQLFDIGPVGTLPTAFHEAFIYYNNTENRVTLWWDGTQVYNAIVGSAKPGQARTRFGALCMRPYNWPKNLTSTVTFDWVGYDEGPGANPPPGVWKTQAVGSGGLLACYLDGSYYPDMFVCTNVMSRWNADTALVTDALYDSPFYPGQTGILDSTVWHANNNDPSTSNVPSGGNYWVSALAINPANGAAWMSWGAEATYQYAGTYGPTGAVYAMGKDDAGPGWSEGVPQAVISGNNSQVVALASSVKWMYALTCDLVTGEYNLFKTLTGVCSVPSQDADGDGDVDLADFNAFQACFNGPNRLWKSGIPAKICACQDSNDDGDVDLADFNAFQACFNGPNRPAKCL